MLKQAIKSCTLTVIPTRNRYLHPLFHNHILIVTRCPVFICWTNEFRVIQVKQIFSSMMWWRGTHHFPGSITHFSIKAYPFSYGLQIAVTLPSVEGDINQSIQVPQELVGRDRNGDQQVIAQIKDLDRNRNTMIFLCLKF